MRKNDGGGSGAEWAQSSSLASPSAHDGPSGCLSQVSSEGLRTTPLAVHFHRPRNRYGNFTDPRHVHTGTWLWDATTSSACLVGRTAAAHPPFLPVKATLFIATLTYMTKDDYNPEQNQKGADTMGRLTGPGYSRTEFLIASCYTM